MQAEQALLALVRGSRRGRQEGEDGVLSLPRLCSAPAVSSAGNLEIAKFKNEKKDCCHEQEGAGSSQRAASADGCSGNGLGSMPEKLVWNQLCQQAGMIIASTFLCE